MINVSNSLKQARISRGLTQEYIAKAIGMSRQSYAQVELGKSDLKLSQASALAATMHISIEELLGSADSESSLLNPTDAVEKYKQIVLNALQFGADKDGKITKTKLAKLVYLADFIWYYKTSTPMSYMSYRKLPQGPVADVFFRALDELEESGVIDREEKGTAFLYSILESGEAPSNRISRAEKKLIRSVGKWWQGKQTKEIVDFTHAQLPWQICRDGEVIPYGLITQEEPELVYGPIKL